MRMRMLGQNAINGNRIGLAFANYAVQNSVRLCQLDEYIIYIS